MGLDVQHCKRPLDHSYIIVITKTVHQEWTCLLTAKFNVPHIKCVNSACTLYV